MTSRVEHADGDRLEAPPCHARSASAVGPPGHEPVHRHGGVPQHLATGHAPSLPRITMPNTADRSPCARSALRDPAPEKHLSPGEPTVPDGDEPGIAIPFAGFQLVFIHDEHAALTGLDQLPYLPRPQAACRRKAPFQEFLLADVVILRAGEHEAFRDQQPRGPTRYRPRMRRGQPQRWGAIVIAASLCTSVFEGKTHR